MCPIIWAGYRIRVAFLKVRKKQYNNYNYLLNSTRLLLEK